jgi:molybdopterin-guanine dinucleotide biosynthesis protein A
MSNCFGIILAGGLAQRMGGIDKSLIEIAGRPILERVVESLRPQCAGIALNANGDPSRFERFGLDVVADNVEGFAGPLAGILAGLDYVATHHPEIEYCVSVPVDTPFIPRNLVSKLSSARAATGADVAVASSSAQMHYPVALWKVEIRDALRHALVEEDVRSVKKFIEKRRYGVALWRVKPYDPFFNVNRLEDLAAAEEISTKAKSLL